MPLPLDNLNPPIGWELDDDQVVNGDGTSMPDRGMTVREDGDGRTAGLR